MPSKRPRAAQPPADPVARLRAQVARLKEQLRIADDTLDAIRGGHVDALVVQGPAGDQIFTLQGADYRYRQLVETMNEGALLLSGDGTILYGNARFAALVETPLERMLGTPFQRHLPERWWPMLEAVRAGRADGTSKAEVELLTSDGARVPVYLSATAGWDPEHQLTCVIVTDLTAQKRTQETLAAERLAALIVEQAAEGIVVCDLAGVVIRASQTAWRLAERNPLLRPFTEAFELRAGDDREAAGKILEMARRGAVINGIEVALTRGGERIDLLLSAGPVTNGDGQALGCVVSFIDITERRRASEERLALLERANAARIEAETASRAKDEFLAMLGHELRNPLAPILTALDLMRVKGDSHLVHERDVIERQVQHVVRLVNDLLDVSKITRGKVDLTRIVVELSDLVGRAIDEASPLIEQRRHRLHTDVPPGLLLWADDTRICQVVSNLLTNAAKYSDECGEIWIKARRRGDRIALSVRDQGRGIPVEMLDTVFDRFVQGDRPSDRSEGGLGLGLAIVKSLVTLHGGAVSVKSAGTGRGSEFEICLPAAPAGSVVAPALEHRHAVQHDEAELGRVLIVDDNQEAADMLAETLEALGYPTEVAYDGPSALTVAARFTPDIAVLDIGLPVMDGYELAGRLRASGAAQVPRLIALTGYGQDSDRRRSAEAGFETHLVKPIDVDALQAVLRRSS